MQMNMYARMGKKAMCWLLAFSLFFSNIPLAVGAEEISDELTNLPLEVTENEESSDSIDDLENNELQSNYVLFDLDDMNDTIGNELNMHADDMQINVHETDADYTPEITTQPTDIACGKDGNATLTVVATAPEGAVLTYQWYEVDGETGNAIDGATQASYTATTSEIGEKSYYCVITNTVNTIAYTVQSSTAKVTVENEEETTPVVSDLKIVAGSITGKYVDMLNDSFSRDTTEYKGLTMTDISGGFKIHTTLSSEITAKGTVYYAISYNGENSDFNVLPTSAPVQFNTSKFKLGEENVVSLQIGTMDGSEFDISETYTFHITFIRGLTMLKVFEGGKNVLTPSSTTSVNTYNNQFTGNIASGTESISVQVKPVNGNAIAYIGDTEFTTTNDKGNIALSDYISDDGKTANIPVALKWSATDSTKPMQVRTYTVTLTFVDYTPEITTQPTDIACGKDGNATLTVVATAPEGAALTYQWYEVDGETGNAIDGATQASYTATTSEIGEKSYYCVITNTVNTIAYTVQSNTAKVHVYNWDVEPPRIVTQPHNITCTLNGPATLSIQVESPESGEWGLTWFDEDGNALRSNGLRVCDVDTSTVGAKKYYCQIRWDYNGQRYYFNSSIVTVTVVENYSGPNYTPVILQQPQKLTCEKGETCTLSVEVQTPEKGTLTYQWYDVAYQPVEGATDKTFNVPTNRAMRRFYFCEITNTVDGVGYSALSNKGSVTINLSYISTPIIVKDLGSYYKENWKFDVYTDYQTEYETGELPKEIFMQFSQNDSGVDFRIETYHNTVNSLIGAELVDTATAEPTTITGDRENDTSIKEYYVELNKEFDTGVHYFFCIVTAYNELDPDMPTASLTMGPVAITYKDAAVGFEGSGTEADPYLLQSTEDLVLLENLVSQGKSFSETYFAITSDITLPDDWTPIGCTKDGSNDVNGTSNLNAFSGTIDGKISESKNATITVPVGGLPLLGFVRNAHIKNLNIKGEQIAGAGLVNNYTGVNLSGTAVTIENVRLLSGSRTLKSGLIASVGGNGFACASANFTVTIRNCVIEENVIVGYDGKQSGIGSFAGRINGIVENSSSAATVKGGSYVGGIIAGRDNAMSQCEVKNCTFSGTIEASGAYVGGIVGGGYDNATAPNGASPTIVACNVTGTVKGRECVGGIFGGDGYVAQTWDNVTGSISANTFTGTISGSKYVGAIIGYRNSLNKYDNISGNTYSADCGATNGIGFVKYLDTSYPNPKTMTGTIVINTANGTEGLPTVEGCAWKADHNRTDDPLGTDADKLCKKLGGSAAETPTCYELVVSGTFKTEYTAGEELNLTGIKLTAKWTAGKADTTLSLSDVEVSGYDKNKTGEQTITLSYGSAKAYIKVNVTPKSSKITVSVTIMGDSHHSDPTSNGGPHGLARGGLSTWASASVEADTTNTVWNVLQKVMDDKGITYSADDNNSYGTIYISAVNGLGEFDNGTNSGWMYTLNGVRPEVGVNAKYVSDGDKIVLFYTDDYTYEVGGVNYNKPVGQAAAEAVDKLIAAIGTVSYTDESKAKIDAARKAYDALSDSEKKLVTKLSVLESAEKKYAELKKADDQKQATAVDNLIAAIGTVTKNSGTKINAAWNAYNALTADQKALVKKLTALQSATRTWNELLSKEVIDLIDKIDDPVTESSKDAIEAARTAYDKLTADQKKLVTNYEKLTKAETELAKLTATEEDKKKAQEVIDMIDKLGEITADSEKDVEEARKAYDALTDLQKKLVENYDKLEAAEAKLKLMKAMGKVTDPYIATGDYMINLGTPGIGSVGGEWMVIGLARSDRNIPNVEDYYNSVIKYVQENIDENERLHKAKSTDNSRMILALTAIGKDVTDVDGHNLLAGLNSMDYIKKQGNNGPIWALIALDSGNYPVPEGDVTRQALIDEILRVQTSDGGWAISGDEADADMTGMALTALAPYYKKDLNVLAAVDKAIECLSQMQDADGGFSTFSGDGGKVATSESTAQVIVALTALGINPDTDSRFIKNGNSAVDALIAYFVNGGGFKHIMTGERDGMATEQAYYALTAYYRFLEEKTRLYDMTDVIDMGGDPEEIVAETTEPTVPATTEPVEANDNGSFPWAIMVLVLAAGFGGGIATVTLVLPRIKKKRS